MRLGDMRLAGWSLLVGTILITLSHVLSPGRGAVDTVPSTSLTDLTLAMARNELLSYSVPVAIIFGGVLMLHGLMTLRRYAGPVPRLGLLAMAVSMVLLMAMRGLDYMIVGLGVAALESEGDKSQEWLQAALGLQRMAWGYLFTSTVAGQAGTVVMALGLMARPEPLRLPSAIHAVAAFLAFLALAAFLAAWQSNDLELALAPAFAAGSIAGLIYMALLGWGLVSASSHERAGGPTGG